MPLWNVDMIYATSVCVEVEATTYDEAVERAKDMVDEYKSDYFDLSDVEFEELVYVSKLGRKITWNL